MTMSITSRAILVTAIEKNVQDCLKLCKDLLSPHLIKTDSKS